VRNKSRSYSTSVNFCVPLKSHIFVKYSVHYLSTAFRCSQLTVSRMHCSGFNEMNPADRADSQLGSFSPGLLLGGYT